MTSSNGNGPIVAIKSPSDCLIEMATLNVVFKYLKERFSKSGGGE
jgi:hypothetical protein